MFKDYILIVGEKHINLYAPHYAQAVAIQEFKKSYPKEFIFKVMRIEEMKGYEQ